MVVAGRQEHGGRPRRRRLERVWRSRKEHHKESRQTGHDHGCVWYDHPPVHHGKRVTRKDLADNFGSQISGGLMWVRGMVVLMNEAEALNCDNSFRLVEGGRGSKKISVD